MYCFNLHGFKLVLVIEIQKKSLLFNYRLKNYTDFEFHATVRKVWKLDH